MIRDFFLGFIKIHILHHASKEPVFGSYLMEELASHGYSISPGTLYPTLHAMEKAGYLAREDATVNGKIRKYYSITPSGLEVLEEAKLKMKELMKEVL